MTVQQTAPTECARVDLRQALQELEAWQAGLPAELQRRFTRFPARGQVRLVPGCAGRPVEPVVPAGHIRDVSRGGLSVIADEPQTPGTFWQVQLANDKVVVSTLPGVCRYCRPVIPGTFLIGVEFGLESSILLSLGVSAGDLAARDESECRDGVPGAALDPSAVLRAAA
jgi:hypothetical protein